jgi:hypothetical protein
MTSGATLRVEGYRELQIALRDADRDLRLGVRKKMREAAEPVRSSAAALALAEIPRMAHSPQWAAMRTGQTSRVVYVAPRKRGVRDARARRPKLADLLMRRALLPALYRNEQETVRRFESMLDQLAGHFNSGGPVHA